MRIRNATILALMMIGMTCCVEEYIPEIDNYENLLVVDGMITSGEGPYEIKLSRSAGLQNPEVTPVENAIVILRDDHANSEKLTETEAGVYSTIVEGIKGIPGYLYQLEIQTAEGETYLSDFEMMREPVGIEQVTTAIEYHPGEEYAHEIAGLRFYIDTHKASDSAVFLMWSLTETYEYKSDFKIRYYWEGELKPFPRPDSLQTCWKTQRIPFIFTSRTDGLSEPVIRQFPLHYVNTDTRKLYLKYSLLVKQYAMNKEAWSFWNEVRKQNETQGGLFDLQPYQIVGNMKNTNNPNEPVLGQFTVAGVFEHRIFVDRPNLDFYYFKCELTEGDFENFSSIVYYPPESWPIYVTTGLEGGLALPLQECLDCRLHGGTIEKPVFWTDNK